MTPEDRLIQLQRQVLQLEQMILDQGRLGLSQGRTFIYVQKSKQSLWTFIATDEPVPASSITGYVIDLYRKEDEVPKLHVVIRTQDAEYVLCSGFETHFSRDIMAAIAQLKPIQLKRPLKFIPSYKEPKPGEKQGKHQPVYANVLFNDQTIRTYQFKRDYSADELFKRARSVLRNSQIHKGESFDASDSKPEGTPEPSLPPIPPLKSLTPESQTSVDWEAFCETYQVEPGELKTLALDLGLPLAKLSPNQNAQLYDAAWKKFVISTSQSVN